MARLNPITKTNPMPRQNFISQDFFAQAPEKQVKSALMEIPAFENAISFVRENTLVQSWRFRYEHTDGKAQYIDVSFMHLNDGHTHITMHGSYENGHSFYKDRYLSSALKNFESAAKAALHGSVKEYVPERPRHGGMQQLLQYAVMILSSAGIVFLWKKIW